jgi:Raf kinase inhibitor-like YbhB/YbcL family protein
MNICKGVSVGLFVMTTMYAAAQQAAPARTPAPPPLLMTIAAYPDGATVPVKYSCVPGDASVSPEIKWSQVPPGTQSFALVLSDLDYHPEKAMADFAHWIVWNIPATATSLPEGVPAGATLADGSHQTGARRASYLGPCAAAGPDHHYRFTLYALDTILTVPADAKRPDVMKAAEGHVLSAATWLGLFHK